MYLFSYHGWQEPDIVLPFLPTNRSQKICILNIYNATSEKLTD